MVIALILAVSAAILFCVLYIDERSATLDYRNEIKDLENTIRRMEEESRSSSLSKSPSRISQIDDQDLWDLTPDLVADVVRFNGYVPVVEDSCVTFMIQGERYIIDTDRIPYVTVHKQYRIDKDEHDVMIMRQASDLVCHDRMLGKATISSGVT